MSQLETLLVTPTALAETLSLSIVDTKFYTTHFPSRILLASSPPSLTPLTVFHPRSAIAPTPLYTPPVQKVAWFEAVSRRSSLLFVKYHRFVGALAQTCITYNL